MKEEEKNSIMDLKPPIKEEEVPQIKLKIC